ncbi:MAG TPA: hypothetical protein VNW68_02920 [Candidatus Limnocylindria bacterium]|nr:hypothetical protein [Candidatus Limnocylindria bacterium]
MPQAWEYIGADFPLGAAIEISALVATDSGFVAVGYEPLDGEDVFGLRQGIVWRSADGRSWQRSAPADLLHVTPLAMASFEGQLYIGGTLSSCPLLSDVGCDEPPEAGNAVWRSVDGASWQRLDVPETLGQGLIDGMVVGAGQLAIHGGEGDAFTATVWLTSDGLAWAEQRQLGGPEPISVLHGDAAGFVAFGTRYDEGLDAVEVVASRSADGMPFEPASVPAGIDATVEGVAFDGRRYVAVGHGGDEHDGTLVPITLISLDGRDWRLAEVGPEMAGAGLRRIAAVPDGLIAIGFYPESGDSIRDLGYTWFSDDGESWRPIGPLAGAEYSQLSGVAHDGRTIVVTAVDFDAPDDDDPYSTVHVWVASLAALTIR